MNQTLEIPRDVLHVFISCVLCTENVMCQPPNLLAEITALANASEEPSTSGVFDITTGDMSESEILDVDEIVPHKRRKCRKNLMQERTISVRKPRP